jgi:hypothetical protein
MAPTYKKTFVYSGEHKYHGELASSSSSTKIPNSGVHKITAASTYKLEGPYPGALVTIYAVGVDASINCTSTFGGSTGQAAFNSAGGTQVLNLLYDSTSLNDPMVTLIGESATQWRIMSFAGGAAMATSNAGISVTT